MIVPGLNRPAAGAANSPDVGRSGRRGRTTAAAVSVFPGGYRVLPITLERLLALRALNCAVLDDAKTPGPDDVATFLWTLSPERPGQASARDSFFRRCRRDFYPPRLPLIHFPWAMRRWQRKALRRLGKLADLVTAGRAHARAALWEIGERDCTEDAVRIGTRLIQERGFSAAAVMAMPVNEILKFGDQLT